jgi:steroid 5-alpha reductase family enzyme
MVRMLVMMFVGIFWYLKDSIFPDPSFQKRLPLLSALGIYLFVLGPYLVPAYRLASRAADNEVSFERAWVCTMIYVFGVVIMLLSDSQKYYTLKYKKGLISDGMMKYTRNPNYLGEVMIYGAFILLVNDTLSYTCVMQVWFIVFTLRIMEKENSLRKKDGWKEYSQRSWVLIPKINGRTIDSILAYGISAFIGFWMYNNGGIKSSLILIK